MFLLQVHAASLSTHPISTVGRLGVRDSLSQAKYLDLLARYYIMKRQHLLAAHVLLRLAERRSMDERDIPSLEQRLVLYINPSVFFTHNIGTWHKNLGERERVKRGKKGTL